MTDSDIRHNENAESNGLDATDRKILNHIQLNFPITSRPYQTIAHALDMTEDDVVRRVKRLRETGIIRRIGGNFGPDKVGYHSTLCAASVPPEKVAHFTSVVNAYTGVTHNYLREHHFNVWFTFIAPSVQTIRDNLARISSDTGISPILNLPSTRVFKISANFKL